MREIKFRAWNGMELFNVYEIDLLNGVIRHMFRPGFVNEYDLKEVELMQYTGLKDKNGLEIYDGDILQVPDLYETPENTSMTYHTDVIDFAEYGWRLGGQHITDDYDYISDECEVIGNKFENPELLEQLEV